MESITISFMSPKPVDYGKLIGPNKGRFLNIVYPSYKSKKGCMVFVRDKKRVREIHFGEKGNHQNRTYEQWERYIKRAAFIKDGKGRKTANNRLSPNYWAIRILWDPKDHKLKKPFTLTLKNGNKIYIKP